MHLEVELEGVLMNTGQKDSPQYTVAGVRGDQASAGRLFWVKQWVQRQTVAEGGLKAWRGEAAAVGLLSQTREGTGGLCALGGPACLGVRTVWLGVQ